MTVPSIHPANWEQRKSVPIRKSNIFFTWRVSNVQRFSKALDSMTQYMYGTWNAHGMKECSLHFISLIVKNILWRKQHMEYKGFLKFISPGYWSLSWGKSRQDCKTSPVFTVTWQTQPRTETNKCVQIDAFICIQCRPLWVGWFFSHHLRQLCQLCTKMP